MRIINPPSDTLICGNCRFLVKPLNLACVAALYRKKKEHTTPRTTPLDVQCVA